MPRLVPVCMAEGSGTTGDILVFDNQIDHSLSLSPIMSRVLLIEHD